MLNPASARRGNKKKMGKLNLVPILDAVFIFIFFLLASSSFVKMYELASDVPTVSDAPPENQKNNKPPLNLTVKALTSRIEIWTGAPSKRREVIRNIGGKYNLKELHQVMIRYKQKHPSEDTVILEPVPQLSYDRVIDIMDQVRVLNFNDPVFTRKNDEGEDVPSKILFNDIIFGNLEE